MVKFERTLGPPEALEITVCGLALSVTPPVFFAIRRFFDLIHGVKTAFVMFRLLDLRVQSFGHLVLLVRQSGIGDDFSFLLSPIPLVWDYTSVFSLGPLFFFFFVCIVFGC